MPSRARLRLASSNLCISHLSSFPYLLNRIRPLFLPLSISSEIRNNEIHIAVIDYTYINTTCVYLVTPIMQENSETVIEDVGKWN